MSSPTLPLSPSTGPARSHRGWHRPDLLSLFFGIAFTVIGATAALSGISIASLGVWGARTFLLPGIAVLFGIMILARVAKGLFTATSEPLAPTSAIPGPADPFPTPGALAEEDHRWLADDGLTVAEREVLEALHANEAAAEPVGGTVDEGSAQADEPDGDQGKHDPQAL